jgi:hypothetical protein
MGDRSPPGYRRYVYWLTAEQERRLRKRFSKGGTPLRSSKGVVCTALNPVNTLSSVSPSLWQEGICSRQGSWYRKSDRSGLFLVVSRLELKDAAEGPSAILTESDFTPPRRAEPDQKAALLRSLDAKAQIPPEWFRVNEAEKRSYMRWAKRNGSTETDFEALFLTHTANHANFIEPLFFIREQNEIVPYSIDSTAHLCSCCLELFQVIGRSFRVKFVAPCAGAAVFAGLPPDRYLRVETFENTG